MKFIRFFRHIDCEGPGYFGDYLQHHDIHYDVIAIDEGQSVPDTLDDIAGLVFLGGSMSVNDELDWIADEVALIQHAVAKSIPVMGFCLGSQLMSKAFGCTVRPGPCLEVGWHPVKQVAQHGWLEGLPSQFDVFHWHGETFDLPDKAELLLSSDLYKNQAYTIGPHLALQCHVEMTAALVEEWTNRYSDDLTRSCTPEQDAKQMCSQLESRISNLNKIADQLFDNWLQNCVFS